MMKPVAPRLSLALLALAVCCSLASWQLQASAADDLGTAGSVQQREVPDGGGAPPNLAEYRQVLDALDASLAIRTDIDTLLAGIETSVSSLEATQSDALDVVTAAIEDLENIAASLDSSGSEARASDDRLQRLSSRLDLTAVLAQRIAEELEELDRRFGPTVGGNP